MFLVWNHAVNPSRNSDLILFELILNDQEALVVHEAVVAVEMKPVNGFVYWYRVRDQQAVRIREVVVRKVKVDYSVIVSQKILFKYADIYNNLSNIITQSIWTSPPTLFQLISNTFIFWLSCIWLKINSDPLEVILFQCR